MASKNVVGAIVVDHSSRPFVKYLIFMLYSVYDRYSALCLKVTKTLSKTRRTSVCTMSACLLTGRKRRQSLGGSSHSTLGSDSDRGLALR